MALTSTGLTFCGDLLLQLSSLSADITYSIQNVGKIPAELVYVRLKQQ